MKVNEVPIPGEHKTVQSRILEYLNEIGWEIISRENSEEKRGFSSGSEPTIYHIDTLYEKILEFNPKYSANKEEAVRYFSRLKPDIYGNKMHLEYLRNNGKFFCEDENRELDLILINYNDLSKNKFEVTEEFYFHNGSFGIREDVVLLINGIPIVVIECKNANKSEAIALGVDQIRRYHDETPEIFVPEMIFAATEAIGFSYGVTWNLVRRNIFNWKHQKIGDLELKIKSFCDQEHIVSMIKENIVFAEKDERLNKYILRQHQSTAVEKVVKRCHDNEHLRGLIWHTQGSGKTFTMIKAAEILFKSNESRKPTILLMIDRNELEDQLLKNLSSLGLKNIQHADNIKRLVELLANDYRGIIVSTIQKFRGMPVSISTRENIYILIDEAHRTTGGDLGNFLVGGLPNATLIGFTGTPIDKTAYGKGTFKIFGKDDPKGYLDKYSIQESIEDGTTLPLYYNIAPNEMLANRELMEKEFWANAKADGITDIAELNKILDRAINLKNFIKGSSRIKKISKYIANHYRENIEPLGYKAFLVAVDREACAMYKKALDEFLPPEYSQVVYTGNNSDSKSLKEHHIDNKEEKEIRKDFARFGKFPKILIVTQKLLTGFDAPLLYAMYLDKPMRDHTLLQAISRVNRPYENDVRNMLKPSGFILDFVGIFEDVTRALSFDSEEVASIIKDIDMLKHLFDKKMNEIAPRYLKLVKKNFNDKDVDGVIEFFRVKELRLEFFKEFKEIEMLYEIISPDKFMRPHIDSYATLSAIYEITRKAYSQRIYVDRAFQKKTNRLVQEQISTSAIDNITDFIKIDSETIQIIKDKNYGDSTKIINLIKSIQNAAEHENDNPFLIAMYERALEVQENFEKRQQTTQESLAELLDLIDIEETRKREQSEKGFDSLSYFVLSKLTEAGVANPESITSKIKDAFIEFPNWQKTTAEMRELRKKITIAIFAEEDDLDKITNIVEQLLTILSKTGGGK